VTLFEISFLSNVERKRNANGCLFVEAPKSKLSHQKYVHEWYPSDLGGVGAF
jgi:hypothetical protein